MTRRTVMSVALAVAGVGVGLLAVTVARREPPYAFAADDPARAALELAAGWSLLAVGVIERTKGRVRFGTLLAAASMSWLAVEWNNPGIGSGAGFAVGLSLSVLSAPLVVHAALCYPSRRLTRTERVVVGSSYLAGAGLLGLLPTVVFDPARQGCSECPANPLLVHNSADAYATLQRLGAWALLVTSAASVVLLAVRLVRSSPVSRRTAGPILASAGVFLAAAAADAAHGIEQGTLGNDSVDRRLWVLEAVALIAIALAVAWTWLHARLVRSAVARLAVESAEAPASGGLERVLAGILDDPSLVLAYPLVDGRFVDASGRTVAIGPHVTRLVRDGEELAVLVHSASVADQPELAREVAAAARLVLDNERLHAEARAQLEQLRESRARIIAAGDAERRRLERDLHDGAQQRLVSLALSLSLTSTRSRASDDVEALGRLDEAREELRTALVELRELAAGIFPAVLAEEGLAAALEALVEDSEAGVRLGELTWQRFDPAVESAAYFVVAEALRRDAGRDRVAVTATGRNGSLVLAVEGLRVVPDRVELADRVGAIDGVMAVERGSDGTSTIRVVIPCES
jgi:signal transduction histidine kinase